MERGRLARSRAKRGISAGSAARRYETIL